MLRHTLLLQSRYFVAKLEKRKNSLGRGGVHPKECELQINGERMLAAAGGGGTERKPGERSPERQRGRGTKIPPRGRRWLRGTRDAASAPTR